MKPIRLILDTDAGSDCDDMMAMAYLAAAQKQGLVEPLAITYSFISPYGPAAIRAHLRSLNTEIPPLGAMPAEPEGKGDWYCRAVAEKFAEKEDYAPVPDAVSVLRRALADSDGDVTLCAIGPMVNIAALLQSQADAISPLDGVSLVREKCSRLVLMAGDFRDLEDGTHKPEWNVKQRLEAAKATLSLCEPPIYFLPWEAAHTMITGKPAVEALGERTPLTLSFVKFFNSIGRSSWDPATLLWAIEGNGDFFRLTAPGTVTLDEAGGTYFTPTPDGKHYIIEINQKNGESFTDAQARVATHIDNAVNALLGKQLEN